MDRNIDKPEQKQKIRTKFMNLFQEFDNWDPIFRDIRDFLNPYLGNFYGEDYDDGYVRKDQFMSRSTPIRYADVLASGLQAGITSPTRPWVRLTVPDRELMKDVESASWLQVVSEITMDLLRRGNFYPNMQQAYSEMGVFGTAAMLIQESDKTGLNCHTFTIGEFAIGTDALGFVNQFARRISMTGEQIEEMFPDAPDKIKQNCKNHGMRAPLEVHHLICPNVDYMPHGLVSSTFKYADYYWVDGQDEFLKVSGYHEFPVMVGRWSVNGSNIYGIGPGQKSLADARQLSINFSDMNTAVSLNAHPPVQAPADMLNNGGVNINPSAVNFYNPLGGSDGTLKPVFEAKMGITDAFTLSQAIEESIKDHFNVKVFQLLSDMDKGTRTAREIVELSAEKMSQMGPLVDRMETEMLPQIIERVLAIGFRKKLFPTPPQQLAGQTLNVHYESILAQAQKQANITPIVDTLNQAIEWAGQAQKPEVLDNIDFDEAINEMGHLNGVPAKILRAKQDVAMLRQQQQQAMAMQQNLAAAQQMAQTAKTASDANTDGSNVLNGILKQGGAAQ